jgi:putative signal transducing protein
MSNTVCIKTFQFRHEAEFAKGILESNRIDAFVSGDDYGGAGPHILQATGGAKLMVMEDDAEKSLDILDNYDSE